MTVTVMSCDNERRDSQCNALSYIRIPIIAKAQAQTTINVNYHYIHESRHATCCCNVLFYTLTH